MEKKALIVDDSPSMRQLIRFTLLEEGFDVVEAVNGQEALRKLEAIGADFIITDINMPEMDGITLIKNVRVHLSFKFLPIIVLTTESEGEKKKEGLAVGASAWIEKPFTPEKLLEVIKKTMG
ncbi:MAG TPA: two-component system response regulator [Spirochaetia bacterium]|nr:two-component system response regulator [Spirochaetia bacterium]